VAGCSAPIPAARPAVSRSASAIIAHQGPPVTGAPTRAAPSTAPTPTVTPRPAVTPHAGTLHYIANVGTDVSPVVALGYDLFDTGPDPETLAALPPGGRALVWLGSLDNSDCAAPDYTFAQFAAAVGRLAGNPRVYGYFLADEPHPAICPTAVADIRARADYIRAHDPSHRSFIVVLDGTNQCGGTYGCEFRALGPANTHVDLIGIDPYPCNVNDRTCTYRKIDDTAHRAVANGIPAADLVPVFQVFGQDCAQSHYYRQPTSAELRTMLAHWAAVLPRPAFDYTYTWGRQGSSCPTLIDAKDLQIVMRTHNSE
jgi:hypothetical protein